MDDRQDAIDLALIKQKLQHFETLLADLKTQERRTFSHFDSEKRHRDTMNQRINDTNIRITEANHIISDNKNKLNDHDREFKGVQEVLFNKGTGVVFKVREFQHYVEHNTNTWKTIGFWLGIILAVLSLYISITKK